VYYYKSSKTKAVIKHNELEQGRSVAFFYHEETGKPLSYGIYRNLKKDSVWTNFTPSGRLSNTETYKDDKLHGVKKIYFIPEEPDDKSQIVSTVMNYKEGMLHGEYKEYFLSKRLRLKGVYTDNKQTGAWEEYHVNGKRAATTRYYNGMKHGYAIAYDTSGNRLAKQFYYYGQRLEGKQLEDMLKEMEKKGVNPYTMQTK
jgi:antitoxin component YwqK of YwqJK toxin-antitoxin module